jgi:uncharacterized protein YkwD
MRPALACLAVTCCLTASAQPPADTEARARRKAIFEQANEFRATQKLPAYKLNAILDRIAQEHAENMARQEKISHTLDGKGADARAREAKYGGFVGENVALSGLQEHTIASIMEGWQASAGHRANLLGKSYSETGTGAARARSGRWYYCQVFGVSAGDVKGMVPGGKSYASVTNRSGGTVRLVINKGQPAMAIPDGAGFGVPVSLPARGFTIQLLAADPEGKSIPIVLRNGDHVVITKDGGEFKLETKR